MPRPPKPPQGLMPHVNAMTMAGERVPAGTGETSVATQEGKTTPPSEKSTIGLWDLFRGGDKASPALCRDWHCRHHGCPTSQLKRTPKIPRTARPQLPVPPAY